MKWLWTGLLNFLKSPLSRISFGLVMLTVSLVLISDFLGLMPDARGNEVAFRQHIAKTASTQVSMEIGERSPAKLIQILQSTVESNDRVLSAAVKRTDGTLVTSAGDHASLWTLGAAEESTVEQIRVSLFTPKGEWGQFELALEPMPISESMFRGGTSVLKIVLYVALAGFIGYFFFLRKVMRELDPDQVLPDRVRSALDSLADGLLVLNHDGVIMFCNLAMAKRIGISANNLTGKDCSSLDWLTENEDDPMPWTTALETGKQLEEQAVQLRVGHHQKYQFVVNASPILGDDDNTRGALLTFNDVTELRKQHAELEVAVSELEESKVEIEQKNRELFTMATRDPLTNLFNRRAFFEAFDTLFEKAKNGKGRLGCIMLDIDHFKSVNDNYGHGVGDVVIKYMAASLMEYLGDIDVVGRFGGEEFCLLIPDASIEVAMARAEKIRIHIEQGIGANFPVEINITSSFGVSVLPGDARTPSELVEQADMALYEAKTSGRNVVSKWMGDQTKQIIENNKAAAEQDDNQRADVAPERNVRAVMPTVVEPVETIQTAPGALVLVEPGKSLTQRQLLAANIDTAIARARQDSLAMAVVVLDGSSLQYIANNVDFDIGIKLCDVLVERLKNMLQLSDVVSQGEVEKITGTVTQSEQHEIALLLSDVSNKANVEQLVTKLLAVFDQGIVISGMEYMVDTHAGISLLGENGKDALSLLQNACIACSSAKSTEVRNSYRFYSPEMDEAAKRALRLQSDMYKAVDKGELEVYYQPKMCLVKGELCGLEALLRWRHSKLGMLSPDEFIPIAEKTNLIHRINAWVITEVVDQLQRWSESKLDVHSVAVNVSAVELTDPGFAKLVFGILDRAGLRRDAIEIEITESIRIEELGIARGNLEKFHEAGMAISIDDFGTGYSSLSYLQNFPISRLKIDRMFVDGCTIDEKKAKVIRSIISMGNSLGMRVLAEGVETKEQLLFLRDHHCDEMQGYFVSQAVNAETTTRYLEKPTELSQIVLGAAMGSNKAGTGLTTLPISGLDAVISRFPSNDAVAANDEQASDEPDAQSS